MASVRTGPLISDIRGSVAETTWSRNRGGLYVKERKGPPYQRTEDQDECRTAIKLLTQQWSATLAESQREGWRQYATRFPFNTRLGYSSPAAGINWFVRCCWQYWRAINALFPFDAPSIAPLHRPVFSMTATHVDDLITITLPPSTYDPPPNDLVLWLYTGISVPAGVKYYQVPFRFYGYDYFYGMWDEDPWLVASPFILTAGQKVFARVIAQDNLTGSISTSFQAEAIIS